MCYRGPGFLSIVRFGPSLTPPLFRQYCKLDGDTQKDRERDTTCLREKGYGGEGAKSYDGEKAYNTLNTLWVFLWPKNVSGKAYMDVDRCCYIQADTT
jgi:hypothetical protein